MKNLLFLFLLILLVKQTNAQSFPYDIQLESVTIPNLVGVQSYSYGQHNGKWLIVGGRLDGLHQRQPFASFSLTGHNESLIVVDPVSLETWSASLNTQSQNIREHLRTTNAIFIQDSTYLYIFGGYGYSTTAGDHKTYDNLTIINLPGIIDAIVNNQSISPFIFQTSDSRFAVTGGRIGKINNVYHIVGGQKFDGRYNPMNNPTFVQQYTNEIRRFTMSFDGINLTVNHLTYFSDSVNLHRRDFNVVPQIFPNGNEGLTAFSGVFQQTVDLPFLNSVDIDSSGYFVNNSFNQYFNHYECAFLPAYSASNNAMNTIFFGGIARYYESNGTLITDDNVPFVKTIARVTRESNGIMSEHKLPVEMPGLLGAGAHFIHSENMPFSENQILFLDSLSADTSLVGYIYGGINSTLPNIFFTNTGTQSSASSQVFKVMLIKNPSANIEAAQVVKTDYFQLQAYPNPFSDNILVNFYLSESADIYIELIDYKGAIIFNAMKSLKEGYQNHYINDLEFLSNGIYFLRISDGKVSQSLKVLKN
ncbi:MAG: T9SS type A sorting domain-containing protein [Bacteroidales bacterium]|nr:T9SS type A sorting domain-containing protein [Bacteroidales bacterium]